MNLLKILILLPLSIFCLKLSAQVEDLLRDTNITWIAETYTDIVTEDALDTKLEMGYTAILPLKFFNPNEEEMLEEFVLQKLIFEAVKARQIQIYQDGQCEKPITYDVLTNKELDINLDPTTYDTRLGIMYHPNEKDLFFFRARQVVYYNAAKAQFGMKTLAIALMMESYYEQSGQKWQPYFWIKAEDLSQKCSLSDSSIRWAKRLSDRRSVSLKQDSTVKILKTTHDTMPVKHFWHTFKTAPHVNFYGMTDSNSMVKLTMKDRKALEIRSFELPQIDPETFEMLPPKKQSDTLKLEDITHLRLRQNWYWDADKKQLQIYLVDTALLKNVKNEAGEFLYRVPIFYRRTDD